MGRASRIKRERRISSDSPAKVMHPFAEYQAKRAAHDLHAKLVRAGRPRLYLYLQKNEFVETWVRGGQVPLFAASTYQNDHRDGTQTPDENLIHRSNIDMQTLEPMVQVKRGVTNLKNFVMLNCSVNGVPIPDVWGDYRVEDGLVLCFSVANKRSIADRLRKVACVEILNVDGLKDSLDQQLGTIGEIGTCRYTDDHWRDHFTKSRDDEWQREFRIFWRETPGQLVTIPAGFAQVREICPD